MYIERPPGEYLKDPERWEPLPVKVSFEDDELDAAGNPLPELLRVANIRLDENGKWVFHG
jgi:hypothetical protein